MALSWRALRDRLDPLFLESRTREHRRRAGLPAVPGDGPLDARFPELSRPETFAQLGDALQRTSPGTAEHRHLSLLRALVAARLERRLAASAAAELAAWESEAALAVGDASMPLGEAWDTCARDPRRPRRSAVERALEAALLEAQGRCAWKLEAPAEAARLLGFSGPVAMLEEVGGYSPPALAAEGEQLLRRTEDAYRDVLGYALRKIDPDLRPLRSGDAGRHDLQFAATGLEWGRPFSLESIREASTRWLAELGFSPDAERRIRVEAGMDTQAAAPLSRSSISVALDLRAPQDIRLVAGTETSGLRAAAGWMDALGRAHHLAHLPESAPAIERRLGDASVLEADGALFAHLLLDERWLARYLALPRPAARETARWAALVQLARLRESAAQLSFELTAHARGPSVELADAYAEAQRTAVWVRPNRGLFLRGLSFQLGVARQLRGRALEARLHAHLQRTFNEDFWRNPAAGAYLKAACRRGRGEDAGALAAALTGEPLSLPAAGARLVSVLAA